MDTKRLVIGMLVAMALVLGWEYFVTWLAAKKGWTLREPPAATQPATTQSVGTVPPPPTASIQATPTDVAPATQLAASGLRVATTQPASSQPGAHDATLGVLELTKDLPRGQKPDFVLGVRLDSSGAGLDGVVLNPFSRSAEGPGRQLPYEYQRPYEAHADESRPLATRWIRVDGALLDLAGAQWTLAERSANHALYLLDVQGPKGVLRLSKRYELAPRSDRSLGYELRLRYELENQGGQAMQVATGFNGPLPPVKEFENDYRQIVAGYWDQDRVQVGHNMITEFSPKMLAKDYAVHEDKLPLVWAGASSVYFDAIVQPEPRSGLLPDYVEKVEAVALDPNAQDPELRLVTMRFQTRDLDVPAGGRAQLPLSMFFGPKERAILNADYYASGTRGYDTTLGTLSGGCGTWCTFSWLISGMVYLLRGFYTILRDWGLAIIGLVALVRLLLHPVTKRSTMSMHKMQKLQPEMERLKKKYGDDKEAYNQAMWQFQKENGFSSMLGCLPMFLQMPIWIALYSMLQNTFELRQAPFFYGLTWIKDLSQPDQFIQFAGGVTIPLIFTSATIYGINLLPILLAVVFYLQQKFMPQPAAMTKEQEQQRKMMQWMPVFFALFLYKVPSGLNLYILTSTAIGILESKRIKKHVEEMEKKAASEKVIVETKPTRGNKHRDKRDEVPKRGGLAGWIADLQQRADQMRKDPDKKKP